MRRTWTPWILATLLAGCGGPQQAPDVIVVDTPGTLSIKAEVWADNWFAFYLGERLVIEDSIPITTERSFNAEAFRLQRRIPPATEFRRQGLQAGRYGSGVHRPPQPADGRRRPHRTVHGRRPRRDETIAVTNAAWRCLAIHDAPASTAPVKTRPNRWPASAPAGSQRWRNLTAGAGLDSTMPNGRQRWSTPKPRSDREAATMRSDGGTAHG